MKSFPLLSLAFICTLSLTPVTAQVTFQRSYGTSGIDWTYATLTDQTADGGYGICSYTSYTGADSAVYLVRLDSLGAVLWSNKYNDGWTDPFAMEATSDGGFIIAGATNDSLHSIGAYLLKVDQNGAIQWSRQYGGSGLEQAFAVKETSDGGFIVTGETNSFNSTNSTNLYLFKVNAFGVLEWAKSFGDTWGAGGYAVVETWDGGFVAAGVATVPSGCGLLVKVDSAGNFLWSQLYYSISYTFQSIVELNDHSLVMVGYFGGNGSVAVTKTDSAGNAKWQKLISGSSIAFGYCVDKTYDGGLIIGALSSNYSGIALIKTDTAANVLWAKLYANAPVYPAAMYPYNTRETLDHGFIISNPANAANGDIILIKTDDQGVSGCNESNLTLTTTTSTVITSLQGVCLNATGQYFGHTQMQAIPTAVTTYCGVPIGINDEEPVQDFSLYPNPSNGVVNIDAKAKSDVIVYNAIGEIVLTATTDESGKCMVDLSGEAAGIYALRIISSGEYATRNFVLNN